MPDKMSTEKFIEVIKGMSVMEVADLVKALEDEFGVSAAAPVAAAAVSGAAAGAEGEAAEEKSTADVVLTSAGDKKIQVIKAVRSLTSLGLKEAKALVDEAPKPILEGASMEDAEKAKAAIEEAGGTVELK